MLVSQKKKEKKRKKKRGWCNALVCHAVKGSQLHLLPPLFVVRYKVESIVFIVTSFCDTFVAKLVNSFSIFIFENTTK